jgi:hypothetical protein
MDGITKRNIIVRSPEDDATCVRICRLYTYTHDMACPYTRQVWTKQGVETRAKFNIPTPEQIRNEVLLAKTSQT